ncbi:hypothetical protein GCM10025298_13840 [Natronobiforma cellulositropha]|nr:hypothetical protein [Natronobiforma cellulositropha]
MTDALARYLTVESEDDLTRIVFGVLELLAGILELPEGVFSTGCDVDFYIRIDSRTSQAPDTLIFAVNGFLTDEFGGTNFPLIHACSRGPRIVPTPQLIFD